MKWASLKSLLGSLLNKYHWESYERPYAPSAIGWVVSLLFFYKKGFGTE